MVTRLEHILSWLALPVYIWQGLGVRRKSIRLAPPQQKPMVELKGRGKPINILFIGDSSAAGVGVDVFEEGVSGRLPHLLKQKSGRPIKQRTSGNNSATSGSIRDFIIPHLEQGTYNYIIVSIGVNDTKNFHSGKRFCKEFGTLLYALHAKFPGAKIIWQGLIDMENVPILPSPLNKILGIRSRLLRKNGKILCRERGALAPETKWQPIPQNFSHDGFHASSEGYRVWAEELSDYILQLEETAD
ncbi:MAG: SGNH/GDSL hydrolase family protein [Pseudomonadota bacterium]